MKDIACKWALLNDADYHIHVTVKRFLRKMSKFECDIDAGDTVAHAIVLDLSHAVNVRNVLTFKQRMYLKKWILGYSMVEIAIQYHVSPQTVSQTIIRASKNISGYLVKKV